MESKLDEDEPKGKKECKSDKINGLEVLVGQTIVGGAIRDGRQKWMW